MLSRSLKPPNKRIKEFITLNNIYDLHFSGKALLNGGYLIICAIETTGVTLRYLARQTVTWNQLKWFAYLRKELTNAFEISMGGETKRKTARKRLRTTDK